MNEWINEWIKKADAYKELVWDIKDCLLKSAKFYVHFQEERIY